MPENTPAAQVEPTVEVETKEDYGTLIPDFAIDRFARFLFRKMQEEQENAEK